MKKDNHCSDCKHRWREYCVLFDDLIKYNDMCFMFDERGKGK